MSNRANKSRRFFSFKEKLCFQVIGQHSFSTWMKILNGVDQMQQVLWSSVFHCLVSVIKKGRFPCFSILLVCNHFIIAFVGHIKLPLQNNSNLVLFPILCCFWVFRKMLKTSLIKISLIKISCIQRPKQGFFGLGPIYFSDCYWDLFLIIIKFILNVFNVIIPLK